MALKKKSSSKKAPARKVAARRKAPAALAPLLLAPAAPPSPWPLRLSVLLTLLGMTYHLWVLDRDMEAVALAFAVVSTLFAAYAWKSDRALEARA